MSDRPRRQHVPSKRYFDDLERVQTPSQDAGAVVPRNFNKTPTVNARRLVEKLQKDGLSRMFVVHFFSHHKESRTPEAQLEKENCHYCQLSSWSTDGLYPIGIVNDVPGDTAILDPSFRFIEKNVVMDGIEFADEAFLSGCECDADLDCMKDGCKCLQDLELPEYVKEGEHINPYHVIGKRAGCLRGWMLHSRKPIYECHDACRCSAKCASRIVGRGRKVSLQIFRTSDNRGWGLRATQDIKRGQFVGPYVGELLTPAAAAERRATSRALQKKDIYLFALDKFVDPTSPDPRLHSPYEIDGEFMSGPTRFINHSCDPNLRIFAVVKDHANKPFHELCFFAVKPIERFTELTFDYLDGVDGVKGEKKGRRPRMLDPEEAAEEDEEELIKTRCLCGAKNCRKWLWR